MVGIRKKHKSKKETVPRKLRLPRREEGEVFAIVKKMHGTDQVKAICDDGIERACRITGKMRKRVWMREGDLIIIRIWDFQPSKADIVWRYLGGQRNFLEKKGYLKGLPV